MYLCISITANSSKYESSLKTKATNQKGNISLFLEIYKGTTISSEGKVKNLRDYEYLNLYLIDKPITPIERQQNKDILKLAESIKAKRELEIKNGLYGFTSEFKQSTNFIDYFTELMNKRSQSKGNFGNWDSTLKHLKNFAGNKITFREIDQKFCEKFKNHLEKKAEKQAACFYHQHQYHHISVNSELV